MLQNSEKENKVLPKILTKRLGLCVKQQIFFTQPKMKRIIYSPVNSPQKYTSKLHMMQAITENRIYEEVSDEKKEKQITRYLRDTQFLSTRIKEENVKNSLIGKQAQFKYYENYKNLSKILSKRNLAKDLSNSSNATISFDKDPSTLVLEETEKLGILPCCIGLVKTKGQPTVLNINGQKFGDKYIKAIAAGLREASLIEKCQLSNNRITDIGFKDLMNSLPSSIIKLDLSFNKIVKLDQKLLNMILDPDAQLSYINLEGNLIIDKAAESLVRSSSYSKHLKYLNIRKNSITKKCAIALGQLVTRPTNLQELYIGMNRINEEGALIILKALEKNKSLKVFDYSLNKLSQPKLNCAKAIASVLNINKTLLHIDFSSNNFTQEQSIIIGEGLQNNKKIYGFHFGGNYGYIDSRGFFKSQEREITSLHSILSTKINSYDIVFRRQSNSFDPIKFRNVCWICEGWYEQIFKFVIPEPAEDGKNLVYIHFDFQEYQPRLINLKDINVKYKTMVPPRKYKYFFTWNNQQYTDYVKQNKSSLNETKTDNNVKVQNLDIPLYYQYNMYNEENQIKVERVVNRSGKPKKMVNQWDQLIVDVLPRNSELVNKKQKKVWNFNDSLWAKEWKLEDQQLTKNCFEKDWKNSKLNNFIKNQAEQQKVKQILYSKYKLIKQLYRYFSSWSPFNGDIWAVSNNAFTEFCNQSKIISKDTPLKITDLTFITTNSMSGADWKGNNLVPERGLIRFQFMESLVRLAEEKFKKNGLSDSILGSTEMLMRDFIEPLRNNPIYNNQKWRLQKYFVEENDILVRKYRSIFTQIYKKNSKMKVRPGNKPFMCLVEFKSIIQRIGIAGSSVIQRDIFIGFNCSMMTQVDQIENQRFTRMTEIQFIEAIARCAYILPNNSYIQDIFQKQTPFYAKFEWIIHELKSLCSDDLKNQFIQNKSLFGKSQQE